jgi:hypothetical protein
MASSGMLRRVALVRTDVSEERSAYFIRVTIIGELVFVFLRSVRRLLVTASVVPIPPILVTLMKEELSSSETSVLTRVTRRNIPEDDILPPGRSRIRIPMMLLDIFILPYPLSHTVALSASSTRNLPGAKARPARKVDSLTANCELIVYKMWSSLTTVQASTACYRKNFTLLIS